MVAVVVICILEVLDLTKLVSAEMAREGYATVAVAEEEQLVVSSSFFSSN